MARLTDPVQVLEQHQFPEVGGGCTGDDCMWGLAAGGGPDNFQMAQHQLEMLAEQGFKVTR